MNVRLKPIMFVGTCSDAGKSVINAAFCRIFKQDGYHPAPFKAQNMSLNSYSTPKEEKWDVHRWYRPKPAGSPRIRI